jgi:predicted 2-oxoglutarate/Fe(II)-dependent dioxygenase YbiX
MSPVYGVGIDGRFFALDMLAGRPAVFVAARHVAAAAVRSVVADLLPLEAELVVLADDDLARGLAGCGALVVDSGSCLVSQPIAAPGEVVVLVMDRALRLSGRFVTPPGDHPGLAAACRACLDSLPAEAARDVVLPAPVVIVPNLLPEEQCKALMARFEAGAPVRGEMASVGSDGRPISRIDLAKKNRLDWPLGEDDELFAPVRALLLARCAPEIARGFGARVAYTDRILVARYDAGDGWFARHRDNLAPHVAFREFALSVNLNAGAYQGGSLMFPEYNDHRYAPPTGGGLIFCSSVLHEATVVTRGCRYVLLTFFHGEAAEARRRADS